ncbi:MAG: hypothetical protein AAB486_01350 [Patescibacteria group bacterium]|mgnify:CR=1 FL=1
MTGFGRIALKVVFYAVIPLIILAAGQLLFVNGTAAVLRGLTEITGLRELLNYSSVSPNRVWLLLTTISQVQPTGLAFDTVFFVIFSPESTPLGKFAVQAITTVVTFNLGFFLVTKGPRIFVFWGGVLILQATGIVVFLPLSLKLLEEMGIGFLVSGLVEGKPQDYRVLLSETVPLTIRLSLLGFGVIPWLAVKRIHSTKTPSIIFAVLFMILFMIGAAGSNRTEIKPPETPEVIAAVQVVPTAQPFLPTPTVKPLPTLAVKNPTASIPTRVSTRPTPTLTIRIERRGTEGGWILLVNSRETQIRGVQYFFGDLVDKPRNIRQPVLNRDLAIIQQAGFNTVTGWEEEGFSGEFMQLAENLNLWVIRPITLDPGRKFPLKFGPLAGGNFLNPNFRAGIKENVRQKIIAGKDSPALLFWNIGADEPLEKMANYFSRPTVQVQAAADLIVELAVMISELDPNHPVIISEPQDWYVPYYQKALEKARGNGNYPAKDFLIFGGNFYGHPRPVLSDMKRAKAAVAEYLDLPFGVMEMAPFGVERSNWAKARVRTIRDVELLTPVSVSYVFNPAADPINPGSPDPTQAIVTGLAMTDIERNDNDGVLAALAAYWERPLFPSALSFIRTEWHLATTKDRP